VCFYKVLKNSLGYFSGKIAEMRDSTLDPKDLNMANRNLVI